MNVTEARTEIGAELDKARQAERIGNEGMVRVCARRAAGIALRYWLEHHPRGNYPFDAMSLLRMVKEDETFPPAVRHAAERLSIRITEQFTSPFTTHPIDDANIIIQYCLENS